jgi:hypothetical protein
MGTGGKVLPGRDADHFTSISAEVKNVACMAIANSFTLLFAFT